MNEMSSPPTVADEKPVVIPIEAYVSEEYARRENALLWPNVWQIACREEEIPNVGDFYTYDILDESIIVVRTREGSGPDTIAAYYNVCQHRGRRLTKGCGHANKFYCRFHGWTWDIEGNNTFALDREDWGAALTDANIALSKVQVGRWGGWVWINMNPDCEPLLDYLKPAAPMLDAFELDKMRYRWRQWLHFPANWKTALEAFIESFHVDASHPQLLEWGSNRWWSKSEGKHAWHGTGGSRGDGERKASGMILVSSDSGIDPRVAVAEQMQEVFDTVGTATRTLVDAAWRLKDELPETATADEVAMHLMASAARDDAARGVTWPAISAEHFAACGHDWHIFPNSVILLGVTYALCYRARPNGYDPNSCIFEVYILERYPVGQEPRTEWVHEPDAAAPSWRRILAQDFDNIPEVQKGLKSRGFVGPRPNPIQEVPVTHFHRTLAEYMGTGAPREIG
jgi:nitrite reductase/ring-hydroxylating ferredoxin subunit